MKKIGARTTRGVCFYASDVDSFFKCQLLSFFCFFFSFAIEKPLEGWEGRSRLWASAECFLFLIFFGGDGFFFVEKWEMLTWKDRVGKASVLHLLFRVIGTFFMDFAKIFVVFCSYLLWLSFWGRMRVIGRWGTFIIIKNRLVFHKVKNFYSCLAYVCSNSFL